MKRSVQVRFWLTEEILLEGSLEVSAQEARFFRYVKPLGIVVLSVVLLTGFISFKAFATAFPFGLMALLLIMTGPFQIFQLKRQIRRMKILNEEISWTFSTTGTEQVTKESKSQETWKVYHEAVRREKGFLLYPQKGIAYWLPFSAFNSVEDIEAVDQLIATNVQLYRRIGR